MINLRQEIQTQMDNNQPKGNAQNDQQDFEIIAQDHSSSPQDLYFDEVVGALQQIIFDEAFQFNQANFMKKYCSVFEDTQENKNEYMTIFNHYQKQIQAYVDKSLRERVANFDMPKFLDLLQKRTEQIDQQILDMLQSFTEFQVFKKLMLEYKAYLKDQDNLKGLSIKSNRLA